MNVNKYRLAFNPQAIELDFTIPVEQTWDFTGIDDGYQIYEQEAVKEVINFEDFETARITHKSYTLNPSQQNLTAINYQFFFRDINTPNGYVTSPSYLPKFTNKQIYYYQNQFVNSFWKLDLYDSPITQNQKNYITIILPVWQGAFQPSTIANSIISAPAIGRISLIVLMLANFLKFSIIYNLLYNNTQFVLNLKAILRFNFLKLFS
jgi:hypothetical protein